LAAPHGVSNGYRYEELPLDELVISESNVRHRDITADIDELARSLATFGLKQPIVVQQKGNEYEIIIGQRRYLAAKQLGWQRIPAIIEITQLDEIQALAISFSENVQRRDLAPRDKADACVGLLQRFGTAKAVAEYIGTSEQTVRKWIGYAGVPEGLKALVETKAITVPEAIRVHQHVTDEDKAVAIARRMAEMKAPKTHRNRIIAAIEEAPERPVESIFRRAEETRHEKRITVILPEKWRLALDRAASRLDMNHNDIARDAVIELLEVRRY